MPNIAQISPCHMGPPSVLLVNPALNQEEISIFNSNITILTGVELRGLLKKIGIRGYSKLTKDGLVALMATTLSHPDTGADNFKKVIAEYPNLLRFSSKQASDYLGISLHYFKKLQQEGYIGPEYRESFYISGQGKAEAFYFSLKDLRKVFLQLSKIQSGWDAEKKRRRKEAGRKAAISRERNRYRRQEEAFARQQRIDKASLFYQAGLERLSDEYPDYRHHLHLSFLLSLLSIHISESSPERFYALKGRVLRYLLTLPHVTLSRFNPKNPHKVKTGYLCAHHFSEYQMINESYWSERIQYLIPDYIEEYRDKLAGCKKCESTVLEEFYYSLISTEFIVGGRLVSFQTPLPIAEKVLGVPVKDIREKCKGSQSGATPVDPSPSLFKDIFRFISDDFYTEDFIISEIKRVISK